MTKLFVSNAERRYRVKQYPWVVECKIAPGSVAESMLHSSDGRSLLEQYKDWTLLLMPARQYFRTIESAWNRVKSHGIMWEDYHYRLRNRVTDETIPFELFNG